MVSRWPPDDPKVAPRNPRSSKMPTGWSKVTRRWPEDGTNMEPSRITEQGYTKLPKMLTKCSKVASKWPEDGTNMAPSSNHKA
eukprot:12423105-Karenia_brevis.AAC.1